MEHAALIQLIDRYKADPESVYNTWFVSSAERMKAFRAIRRGVRDTVNSIAAGTFGNDFKGSALEFVLSAITEQKQVFEGAAHPFYWKPNSESPISTSIPRINASLAYSWTRVCPRPAKTSLWPG
jgi:type II restriction enzyme